MMASPSPLPWKEHVLEEIPVADGDVGDAVTCLLHTVLFTRAPGPVRPSEATCHAFPNVSYSLCAVGDVSRKVEQAAKSFEESLLSQGGDAGDAYGHRGSLGGGAASGCLVVAFFERKLKKALFGLMSNEEKIYFEKWVVPVHVTPTPTSPAHQEAATRETERALQNALLHILSAVQTIDHVPVSMYDFEITPYASVEAMQSDGSGTTYGLGLQGSTRIMG